MESINRILSGIALPLLLFFTGFCFLPPVLGRICRHPRRAWRQLDGRGKSSSKRALSVALAGTLGVGNIAGVASAIALGGAGAVFWMWVAAIPAMVLKYAEIVPALRYRDGTGEHGGAMYYIKVAFGGRIGRALAALFAALCLMASLTLGGVVQSHAAAEAVSAAFSLPPLWVGVLLAALTAVVLAGGRERLERVTVALMPTLCLVYAAAALAVILVRRAALPDVFGGILAGAFTPRGCKGGFLGVSVTALRYGVARGLVSNEAGCGTAPIAHAAANAGTPAAQGLWGMVEVFVDTLLLCTLTALAVLLAGPVPAAGDGTALALAAFGGVLGPVAPPLLALLVTFFAFATVLCWSHYGAECLFYFTGNPKSGRRLLPVMTAAVLLGAVAAPEAVWGVTDLILALMTLVNLAALLRLRPKILSETKRL